MTVDADLDLIQSRLHDDGTLWSRAELLRLYNQGYGDLLSDAGAVRRWRPMDLPGRHTFGITQEWEAASAYHGTVRKPTFSMLAEAYQGTSQWEIEAIEGITPTVALGGHTQEWERAYRSGDSDLHFRFSFPRNHERVVRLEWQNRKLHPVGVRELDASDTRWFAQIGEPRWWTTGTGRVRSVELYEIATAYHQAYAYDASAAGIVRSISGNRTWAGDAPFDPPNAYAYTSSADVPTFLHGLGAKYLGHAWEVDGAETESDAGTLGTYTWEREYGATEVVLAVGQPRSVLSTARQYLPVTSDATLVNLCGRIMEWRSSEDSVMALEVVLPDEDLVEADTPTLIPPQMAKYVRYFVLSRAFGRPGEGRQPVLADYYGRRYKRGLDLFRAMGDVARDDRSFRRDLMQPARSRPAYVRLPSTYPSVWT